MKPLLLPRLFLLLLAVCGLRHGGSAQTCTFTDLGPRHRHDHPDIQTVQRAALPEGPYTQVSSSALADSDTETTPAGAGHHYRIVWP